jgi:hypothetical protein
MSWSDFLASTVRVSTVGANNRSADAATIIPSTDSGVSAAT